MSDLTKYPRTKHLPWSNPSSEDKVISYTELFHNDNVGRTFIVTEKLDGENTTLYNDGWHARSLDSKSNVTHTHLLGLWGSIKHQIPDEMRICGENIYAKHSVKYEDAKAPFFYVFSIWWNDFCLPWWDTIDWCNKLSLNIVPAYGGVVIMNDLKELIEGLYNEQSYLGTDGAEGYVIRKAEAFGKDDFERSVVKFVRPNHVQSEAHWTKKKIEFNGK